MLGMNLATLSIPELRRVLDMARARDQADLVDSVLAELRTRGGPPGPHSVDVPAMGFGPEPARMVVAGARDMAWEDEEADPELRRRAPMVILMIAAAVMIAGGLGWGLTMLRSPRAERPAPVAVVVAPAAPAPAPPVPVPSVEPPAAASEPAAAPLAMATADAKAPAPTPAADKAAPSCLTRPTAAERLVCGYPTLGRQHERMVAAYNRALVSGADPLVLDASQAKWRAANERTSDRQKLGDAYQQRIQALNALADHPEPEPPPQANKPRVDQPVF